MTLCPVLWCEREHPSAESLVNPCHYVVLQQQTWAERRPGAVRAYSALCTSLSWQESSERGPYIAIEATGGGKAPHLVILNVGVAHALANLFARNTELYGEGGRFLAESIGLGADILA